MNKKLLLTSLFIILFSSYSHGEEISEQSFIGKWCGKWDQIFEFCLTIDNIESDSLAKYQWKEFPDGKFKKTTKVIERVNLNTLKVDNIVLILNESNLMQANAIGIFKVKTRMAAVSKKSHMRTD